MYSLSPELRSKVERYHSKFWKIMKSSLKVKKENLLIISDHGVQGNNLSHMLAHGYHHAAQKKKLNVNLLYQEVKKGFMFADSHVVEAIKQLEENNIVILAVSNKLGRFGDEKSFRTFCRSRGHRFISATGLGDVKPGYFDVFLEAMSVNYSRLQRRGTSIKKLWDKAEEIRVKTALGTDVTFDVSGMEAIANIGNYHEPGMGGNMPAGEVYIPPRGYYGVNGKVVVDGSMKTAEGALLLNSPVTLQIKEGRVVGVEGEQAHLLQETFNKFEARAKYPERVRHVGELGIGINPGAVLIGSMIMDEKVLGTGHIAVGSNSWFGGEIKTIYHGDQVFKSPVYYVDGKKMKY